MHGSGFDYTLDFKAIDFRQQPELYRVGNHKGGRKYDAKTGEELPRIEDPEKAAAAAVFYERYVAAREHPEYVRQKKRHQERCENNQRDKA